MCYHVIKKFGQYHCGLQRTLKDRQPAVQYRCEGYWTFNGVPIEPPPNLCSKCLYGLGLLKSQCAWCGKFLGYKIGQAPDPEHTITHSICSNCIPVVLYNREDEMKDEQRKTLLSIITKLKRSGGR